MRSPVWARNGAHAWPVSPLLRDRHHTTTGSAPTADPRAFLGSSREASDHSRAVTSTRRKLMPILSGSGALASFQTFDGGLEAKPLCQAFFADPGREGETQIILEALYSSCGMLPVLPPPRRTGRE